MHPQATAMLATSQSGPSIAVQAWNPADKASSILLSAANRTATKDSGSDGSLNLARTTGAVTAGKWFCELSVSFSSGRFIVGWSAGGASVTTYPGSSPGSIGFQNSGGSVGSSVGYSTPSFNSGSILGLALDFATGSVWLGSYGTWFGDPVAGTGGGALTPGADAFLTAMLGDAGSSCTLRAPTTFAVPAGFTAFY